MTDNEFELITPTLKPHFTINGIVKVTDGGYEGRIFHITEIYGLTQTMTYIKCKDPRNPDSFRIYRFDNACAIQIGLHDEKEQIEKNISDYD